MVNDEELIRLWHTTSPLAEAASSAGLDTNALAHEWRRLKRAGRIPLSHRHISPDARAKALHGGSNDYDGRPSVGWFEDPLLARLHKLHPGRSY